MHGQSRSPRLARTLAGVWCGIVIYATLYPLAGWRDSGISPFAFISWTWPRYWTIFDLVANLLVYVPLGFLLCLAFSPRLGRLAAPLLAAALGAALSLSLESIQTWLPTRVPSQLDFLANAIGAGAGASLASFAGNTLLAAFSSWQQRFLADAEHTEMGLVLLGLWLFVPLSPEILLFGAGDLRQMLDLGGAVPFAAGRFALTEAAVIALNILAVGHLAHLLIRPGQSGWPLVFLFIAIGLLLRTLSAALLMAPASALAWLTPGAQVGLVAGLILLAATYTAPFLGRLIITAMALMAATVLINLTPPNPYSVAALTLWQQGHFLNFNGLTRWIAGLWPFLALPYLLVCRRST